MLSVRHCSKRALLFGALASSLGEAEKVESGGQACTVDNVETCLCTFPVGTGVEHDLQHLRPAQHEISRFSVRIGELF